jgi:hypothetical protein
MLITLCGRGSGFRAGGGRPASFVFRRSITAERRDQRITDPEPPSLKLALPILAAAADESHEELQDLWARLLAAAMSPKKSKLIRLRFVEVLKKLDPPDALVLARQSY